MSQLSDLALEYGYVGLFLFSLFAATLIAAPADVLAMSMPGLGFNPWWVGIVATAGGFVGNLVNYAVGKYGARFVVTRVLQPDEDDDNEQKWMRRAERLYERYGVWSLLISGAPFVGDPITTVAGAFRVNLWVFSALVIIGKLAKFALLLGATDLVRGWF